MKALFSQRSTGRVGPAAGMVRTLAVGALLMAGGASAELTDQPVPWTVFVDGVNVFPKQANGVDLHDYESSADPSSGGTGVGADPIDIGSEWNHIDDPTAPHELCNPELSSDTPNGRCGTAVSAFWGHYDGGTPFDPGDLTTAEDDVIFLRMRLVGTPAAGGGARDFAANHWNFLIDIDGDGYKDYWLDLDGGFNLGSASNRIDHIQLLYEPTDVPEISCGGGVDTQLVVDPDDARVAQFTACADITSLPAGHPCLRSHTRVRAIDSQYYLEVQLPMTALKDLDCSPCPGAGGSCVLGDQLVYPLPAGAPDVAYFFSTGNSGVDPLQKDYIAQCELTGNPPDGPCSFPDSTPVSLAAVASRRLGSAVAVDWTTATESATVGFNVYAVAGGEWRRLNPELLSAGAGSTTEPQRYAFEAVTDASAVGIEDVDAFGRTRRHGPFAVGTTRGRDPAGPVPDWTRIGHEATTGGPAQRKAKPPTDRESAEPRADLVVDRDGVYRVSFEALAAAGFDFSSIPAAELALVGRDGPLPLFVTGGSTFGPGSAVEFIGEALDSLYTADNRLRLVVDPTLARRVKVESRPPRTGAPVPWYTATEMVERQRDYSFTTPVADPWFDTSMVVYTTAKTWDFDLTADHLVQGAAPAELTVRLWGGTVWPAAPDHHAVILVNGVEVADLLFDGPTAQELTAALPDGLLQAGSNTLTVLLPGDTGVAWEVIILDSYSLRYPRLFTAVGNELGFTAAGSTFRVDELPDNRTVIYALGSTPTRIADAIFERSETGYSVSFGGTEAPTEHLVVTESAVLAPRIEPVAAGLPPTTDGNDLLIISHGSFIAGLEPLISVRRSEGLLVDVVDVGRVYASYSHGIVHPGAIAAAIADAAERRGTRYVLLVGGDTFDYHDRLGLGSVSFIPSIYAATDDIITHAPVDPLYGDLDDDGVPDVAVGRFPVRTLDELDRLVAKTLDFDRRPVGSGSAVIAADAYDGAQDLRFTGFATRFADDLPASWAVTTAYVDTVGFDQARATLLEQLDLGPTLTSYVGHSGPTMWSFDGLLHVDDVASLANIGQPTVVLQWGCWNTYYVEPRYDSIGMALLVHGDQGAAAVVGSTTLSWVPTANAFSELLAPLLARPGVRLGDALTESKRALTATHGDADDVVLGWTLLGDPTLVLERGATSERAR